MQRNIAHNYDTRREVNGMAIAGMVLGILAAVGFWFPIAGQVVALLAVILGAVGLRKATRDTAGGKGMAITAIVLGGAALVVGLIVTIAAFQAVNEGGDDAGYLPEIQQQLQEGTPTPAVTEGTDDSPYARQMFETQWNDATTEMRATLCEGFKDDPRGSYVAFLSGFSEASFAPTYDVFERFFSEKCS